MSTDTEQSTVTTPNRLVAAPVRPLVVPVWTGAERPGPDRGARELIAGLRARAERAELADLRARLHDAVDIPAPAPDDADQRLHRKDLTFLPGIETACAALAEGVETAIEQGLLALTIGGDHAIAMGSIAGAARTTGRLGVLWLDTHPDVHIPETSPSGHIHGMPLAVAAGAASQSLPKLSELAPRTPWVRPDDICMLGIRDIDDGEREFIARRGVWARTMEEWHDIGIAAGISQAIDHLVTQGVDTVHVSFDLDVIDPTFFPGTGTTWPGGLSVREALQTVRLIGDSELPIRSLDVVELNPLLDTSGASTDIATLLLTTALGERMKIVP